MKEHMQAELGHMFGGGEEDDEDDDEEDENEGSDSEEEEDDGEEDSVGEDDYEDEEEESEEEDEVMKEDVRVEKKASTEENPDGEFSFNPNTNFSEYGEEMEEDSEDEDDKLNNEDSEEESENEDDQMEEEEGPVKPGALMREKESSDRVKASAVVEQLATWDSLLEQRILLQKLLTRASTFPNSLGSFVEGKEHEKEVRVAGKAVEKVVRSSGEVCRLLPGGEAESLQAGDSEAAARCGNHCDFLSSELCRWLGAKHRKLESGRRAGVSN